ncbi:glycosyltransferase [Hansschlegelia beijingensis]|uniref:Glycosyltransferase involved in cell wall biosynthesis n=1 Tax=Hansschlegelia beijingensis TaxID=1133344 RepID=A0A7W6D506_9HYPH|nr:glycosyltransferase [Hansschlegelia beijingensis]MBB3972269.1 glycosyltransferase involved in cell wall biosynthesis [Hansschlegelia beijingensis]
MDVLFIHNNFPGQFVHTSRALAQRPGVRVFAVGGPTARSRPGVSLAAYATPASPPRAGHPLAERFVADVTRGELAAAAMQRLKREAGCDPAVVIGHSGWGETLFASDLFPNARHLVYSEFFYNFRGADVGFDPEFPDVGLRSALPVRTKNAAMLTSLAAADVAVSPTEWQKRQHPDFLWEKIRVIHDGVDTVAASPKPSARFSVPGTNLTLRPRDEVITFVNRQLEPYRGYHVFMRALPAILARRPQAQVVIVGGDGVSYGRRAPEGKTWKDIFLGEVRDRLDLSRVHFVGNIPKPEFIAMLQVSSCHVYLTYPFVLSWSLIEAMAAECLIVASGTPPVREVIEDGVTGRLFDFFDVAGLSERVIETLADREQFAQLGRAARVVAVENYDLARVCLPRQVALIDDLAAGTTVNGPLQAAQSSVA